MWDKLKKILKRCRKQTHSQTAAVFDGCVRENNVCDGTFFPSLLEEMSVVVGFFNQRVQRLLDLHLSSCFSKWIIRLKDKLQGNHIAPIQEGRDLVTYAIFNAMAMRKILKKYDKARHMQIEILQSPWLCELMAFHINSRTSDKKVNSSSEQEVLFEGCSFLLNDVKPSLHCEIFDSVELDIDLTCSICLETLFDPVSLTCGHMLCYLCACKAASVTIERVYESAVHLEELHILLGQSCPEYWEERRKSEKIERIQQTKEYWESQCRLF
ncbi:SPX (SYG1/Pho81/XPR1) domain-containing protein [Striga asiatica]|uniref:RING-type E3 ubiquitin transferase n=1 Tax=Striga asiatica TaxID=4170 RepID=A0A5A7PR20_STRAF|nr:SPX (SYG1/Pho81/XPR1) domain-containing protein [Striga asiatica]